MFQSVFRHILEVVLVLSVGTLIGAVCLLVLKVSTRSKDRARRRQADTRERIASVVTVITILLSVMHSTYELYLGSSGVEVRQTDMAESAIRGFYKNVGDRDFERAYDQIHTARKREANLTLEKFERQYRITQRYANVEAKLDKVEGADVRLYWVSFDVYDRIPANSIYQYNWRAVQDGVTAGFINSDGLVQALIRDLRRNYLVPEGKVAEIRDLVLKKQLHWVLSEPPCIYEIATYLNLKSTTPPANDDSWTHYIQHIRMQYEDGWKVRSGLFPASLVAVYDPHADKP
jgi:heme/copper-type cytochrome/quinol oxidase subunit 2